MVVAIIKLPPSKWVNIHNQKSIVKGIFGWPAHSHQGPAPKEESAPKLDNIFIDVGAKARPK